MQDKREAAVPSLHDRGGYQQYQHRIQGTDIYEWHKILDIIHGQGEVIMKEFQQWMYDSVSNKGNSLQCAERSLLPYCPNFFNKWLHGKQQQHI